MNHGFPASSGRQLPLCLATIAVLGVFLGSAAQAASDAAATLRQADAALQGASAQDVPLFAPGHFAEAARLYQSAAAALQSKHEAQAISAAQQALKKVDDAAATASRV